MNRIDRIMRSFVFQLHDAHAQRIFMRIAYAVIFFTGLYFFPIRNEIFSPETVVRPFFAEPNLKVNIAYLLNNNRAYAIGAYYAYLVAAVLAFFNLGWRIPRIAVYLLGVMLYFACAQAFTSGWLLYNLFAFYLIFLTPNARHPFAVFVSNLSFYTCRFQFLLVYAVAGLTKLTGSSWLDGSAMHYVLELKYYGDSGFHHAMLKWPYFLMVLTWCWLIYQLVVPFLIWWRPSRKYLFMYAVLMHGFIAFGMNLPDFGITMLAGYSLFITESAAYRLDGLTSAVSRKLVPKTTP